MGARRQRKTRFAFQLTVLSLCAVISSAQTSPTLSTSRTVRKHRVAEETNSVAPAVVEAESALEKGDYSRAEKLLLPVTELDPRDYRAWFDLAYVYRATQRQVEAIDAYRKSLKIKPDVFATNLNLGLMLASTGSNAEAVKFLSAATQLKPESKLNENLTQAWMALGRALSVDRPNEAVSAFRKASQINPQDLEPHLLAAALSERQNDLPAAESEYKAAMSLNAQSKDARAGLTRVYINANRLLEAEAMLRDYTKQNPNDPSAHLQLGRLLVKNGHTDDAVAEFEAGLKETPRDQQLLREVASIYANAKKYDEAAARYKELVRGNPNEAKLRHEYGIVLLHQHNYAEAQQQLMAALNLEQQNVDAYGDLALAASENKDYRMAIRVLDARAKLTPDTAATYFLRATAYDNLKAFSQASENYHQFLAVSNGQFPDREWQARHRLIAIEPEGRKKK